MSFWTLVFNFISLFNVIPLFFHPHLLPTDDCYRLTMQRTAITSMCVCVLLLLFEFSLVTWIIKIECCHFYFKTMARSSKVVQSQKPLFSTFFQVDACFFHCLFIKWFSATIFRLTNNFGSKMKSPRHTIFSAVIYEIAFFLNKFRSRKLNVQWFWMFCLLLICGGIGTSLEYELNLKDGDFWKNYLSFMEWHCELDQYWNALR